jgi:hypothetical protein
MYNYNYNYNYTRPHHLLFSFCTVKMPIEVLMMVGFMDRGSSLLADRGSHDGGFHGQRQLFVFYHRKQTN